MEPFGGHMLFVRNAVFVLVRAIFGLHPEGYGWLSLITHLVNVALSFRLACAVTKNAVASAFGAAAWGACALHSGTLEGHSVYGHAVVATFLLWVLTDIARQTESAIPVSTRRGLLWAFLLLVGSTCFGVGIGVAVAFPAVVAVLLDKPWRRRGLLVTFLSLPLAVTALYALNRWLYSMFEALPAMPTPLYYTGLQNVIALLWHLCAIGLSGLWGVFPLLTGKYPTASTPWIEMSYSSSSGNAVRRTGKFDRR